MCRLRAYNVCRYVLIFLHCATAQHMHQVFNNELKLYEDEGIEVVVSSCPDNSECIELLSGRLVSLIV
jgi:hypothetical protein